MNKGRNKHVKYPYVLLYCMFVSFSLPSAEHEAEILYEVLFDEEFPGGLHIR